MADMTEAQVRHLRKDIADADAKPYLSYDELQEAFDLAEEDLDATRVIALRWMLGRVEPGSKRYQQVKDLLAVWEKAAGMEGGPLRTGVINLGIDQPEESEWS